MHGVLWSLALNILTYVVMSLARQPSSIERLQADLFVPNTLTPIAPTFRRWRTTVTVQDIQSTVAQYLGPERARQAFEAFAADHPGRLDPAAPADFELLQHAEHLIASSIGAASSRLVMSLLLRKRTVSAKAALKLLDDSHAALHFNREILQTALNHVRQGIAVFDAGSAADLLEPAVRRNPRAAAASGAARHSLAGNPRIHGRRQPARRRRQRYHAGAAARRLHHRGRALSGTPAGPPHGDRGPLQPDAGRRARHHLLRRHAELRGRRSAGARQCDAGKARARPHRGTHPPEFRTGAGQEHRRGRQYLEDAVLWRPPATTSCSR